MSGPEGDHELPERGPRDLNDRLASRLMRDWSGELPSVGKLPPQRRFGPYELREGLGAGGMGAVFRARCLRSGREVALKVLTSGQGASAAQKRRFLREARALAKVRHPNVVALVDAGETEGAPYIALEYHAAGSLTKRLEQSPEQRLPISDVFELGIQLADALAAGHAQGVLHRDLKPDNVLLDEEGQALLTDYGLAKDLSRAGLTQSLTKSGAFLGTPGFWAPEQAQGRLDRIGPRTDIYGLGALLYVMTSGCAPIEGSGLIEILQRTIDEEPAPLRELRPDCPRPLELIVARCLAKEPADRWETAGAVRAALREAASGRDPLALPFARSAGRRNLALAVVALAALALSGFALASAASQNRPAATQAPLAPAEMARASTSPASSAALGGDVLYKQAATRIFFNTADAEALELLARAADQGSVRAMALLADLYLGRRGVEPDYDLARTWSQRGAALGDAHAMAVLGVILEAGLGGPVDRDAASRLFERAIGVEGEGLVSVGGVIGEVRPDLARELFERGAAQGDAACMDQLAQAYLKGGLGLEPDVDAALGWYERASALGSSSAMRMQAECLYALPADDPRRDPTRIFNLTQRAASAGEVAAVFRLGVLYRNGVGVERDRSESVKLYERAARLGLPDAMEAYGKCCLGGDGVERDPEAGRLWLERAAKGGDVSAMSGLAAVYYHGKLLKRDYALARHWFDEAARRDDTPSMVSLGHMLTLGLGGPKDAARGLEWFERAADLGDPAGMRLFADGLEGSDPARALSLYRKSAEAGDAASMGILGFVTWRGLLGATKSVSEGIAWLERAVAGGDVHSMYLLGGQLFTLPAHDPRRDSARIVGLLREAIRQGHPEASRLLQQVQGHERKQSGGGARRSSRP